MFKNTYIIRENNKISPENWIRQFEWTQFIQNRRTIDCFEIYLINGILKEDTQMWLPLLDSRGDISACTTLISNHKIMLYTAGVICIYIVIDTEKKG